LKIHPPISVGIGGRTGELATDYANFTLSFNNNGSTVYLERDENTRDRASPQRLQI
jgi:hypothetical protein